MYYIFLKTSFSKDTIVIRHLFSLTEVEEYILSHNKEHVSLLLKDYTKEHSPEDEKFSHFYPLKETPLIEKMGNLEGKPNQYRIVYKKNFLSKGWIYNSNLEIQTVFEYTICKYDNVLKKPDPRMSLKKNPAEKTLTENLCQSEFFQRMYYP